MNYEKESKKVNCVSCGYQSFFYFFLIFLLLSYKEKKMSTNMFLILPIDVFCIIYITFLKRNIHYLRVLKSLSKNMKMYIENIEDARNLKNDEALMSSDDLIKQRYEFLNDFVKNKKFRIPYSKLDPKNLFTFGSEILMKLYLIRPTYDDSKLSYYARRILIIKRNNLNLLKYSDSRTPFIFQNYDVPIICEIISLDNVEMMQYVKTQKEIVWNSNFIYFESIRCGAVKIFQWIISEDNKKRFQKLSALLQSAIQYERIQIGEILRKLHFPWECSFYKLAIQKDSFTTLEWLKNSVPPCPLDEKTATECWIEAINKRKEKSLKWLISNNVSYNQSVLKDKIYLHMIDLKWAQNLYSMSFPFPFQIKQQWISNISVLCWLLENKHLKNEELKYFHKKYVKIIVAIDKNRGIGKDNKIPWMIKKDLEYFKNITTLTKDSKKINAVIMGKNTFFSIPEKYRPLPNRYNIVVSKTLKNVENVKVVENLQTGLIFCDLIPEIESIFIIGGEELYKSALEMKDEYKKPILNRIYITKIDKEYNCDRFFPTIDKEFLFKISSKKEYENDVKFVFLEFGIIHH